MDNREYQTTYLQARHMAFREGWCTWFSVAAQYPSTGDRRYVDYGDDTPGQCTIAYEHDLDDYTGVDLDPGAILDTAGEYYESMVACTLWDLYDNRNTTSDQNMDRLSLGVDEIWQTTSANGANNPNEILGFWVQWFQNFPTLPGVSGYNIKMTDLFLLHHMTFVAQRPENPSPPSASINVPTNLELAWGWQPYIDEYDIALGESPFNRDYPEIYATVTDTVLVVSALEADKLYFWTVIAKGQNAAAESWTWYFTTGACDCPYPGDLDGGGYIDATDLTLLINVIFWAAPMVFDPYCPIPRGDLNGSGVPNATDLTLMINHIFYGGPPPVDGCG